MTATEKRYAGRSDHIVSMEDPEIYGNTVELLSFKKALESDPPILSDYRVVTIMVTKAEVAELINENLVVKPKEQSIWTDGVEAETLATVIALRKAMQKYPIRHAVSFHNGVARARAFKQMNDDVSDAFQEFGRLDTFHVCGKTPTAIRSRHLDAFAGSTKALVTNARCLTEGIDVPNIDCVVFADPRKSAVDIVQATGRALRPAPGKELGYVVIPLLINEKRPDQEVGKGTNFDAVLTVLKALAANDERIIEYFRATASGTPRKDLKRIFDIDESIPLDIDVEDFIQALELQLWSRLAKLAWRSFSDAVCFVGGLQLKNRDEWDKYCHGGYSELESMPEDIPMRPNAVYKDRGWSGWGHWLGTGNVAPQNREYRSFEDARRFVHRLRLRSKAHWYQFCDDKLPDKGTLPNDVPRTPSAVYKDVGWESWGDWLGTGTIAPSNLKYRSFEDAREFAHSLGLHTGTEWKRFCKGEFPEKGNLPTDIPTVPWQTYKHSGWKDLGDWLGTGRVANQNRTFRPFEEARKFVHGLGLRSIAEWKKYYKGELIGTEPLPPDIPTNPARGYKDSGWLGFGDWLGTGNIAPWKRKYRPFSDARLFVHELGIQSQSEWWQYCKGDVGARQPLPDDIPASPQVIYRRAGWLGWGDWFGTGREANQNRTFRRFEEARDFARNLQLQNYAEWRRYCKGNLPEKAVLPKDIPADPAGVYKDSGWSGWGDWLGTGYVASQKRRYRLFPEARRFVHQLGLQSGAEWKRYCKGELNGREPLPEDIPRCPEAVYKDKGWSGLSDWLGTGITRPKKL